MGMTVNAMAGMQAASETVSDYSVTAKAAETSEKKASAETEKDAVYEKSSQESAKAPYSINKMSKEDRAALVKQLKADQESRQNSLTNLVSQMLGKQAGMYGIANGDDSIWKIFANGNFTVDAATKAQAQEDISDDGYWGVKQTSQRLFDFASALAGDDEDKMREMQKAMEKGFKQATAAWGKDLPDISNKTLDAANKLFDAVWENLYGFFVLKVTKITFPLPFWLRSRILSCCGPVARLPCGAVKRISIPPA